jgi:hypothetical protein
VGPKNPSAHDSQAEPVKPGGQSHVAEALQTAELEHGGEQADDWISTRARGRDIADGSWETSGTESRNIKRDEPEVNAAQTLLESAKELAGRGREEFIGEEGSFENDACPAKSALE